MHNLLRFIKLNQTLLLFILVEGISIALLIKNNTYQSNKILEFSMQYTSAIYNQANSISEYVDLRKTNEYLIKENSKLHTLLNKNHNNNNPSYKKENFKYIPAKVINNSVKKRNNFITIDRGWKSGIANGMGVITNEGVIGVVHSVSENYSLIISLLNNKSAIGIFLKKNMHTGILKWKGFDYKTATINDFPAHIELNIGDTIITNSYSNIYPEGINIGSINNIKRDDNGFYTVHVSLFEDFNSLRYVYIVHSTESEEQILLEKSTLKDE